MPTSENYLVSVNAGQIGSETDSFTEKRYMQFSRYLPKKSKLVVLDVGAGVGRGGKTLKSLHPDMTLIGLDCVAARVEVMPHSIYSERLCALASSLPLQDRSIDAIVAGEFIEHVPPEMVDSTLCEFFRVLSLHGRLLLTTPNPQYLKNKLRRLSVLSDLSHVSQHYPRFLKSRLLGIGFSSVFTRGSGRVTNLLGCRAPLFLYGSYFCAGTKW